MSCYFPVGFSGHVWCLIVSIPDLCTPTYFPKCTYLFHLCFQPEDSDVISEDISDAETESDIETETIGESKFVQLKEKEQVSVQ